MLRKSSNILVTSRFFINYQRQLATAVKAERKKRAKKDSDELNVQKDILKYYSENAEKSVALQYPDTILRKFNKKKKLDGLYIADALGIDKIFNAITKNLPDDMPIIEANPGIGILTRKLMNETKNPLILFEPDKIMYDKLKDLVEENSQRNITLKNTNFIKINKLQFLDKFDDGTRVSTALMELNRVNYYEDIIARVFASIGPNTFFFDLVNAVIFQNSFFINGRLEFFLCVPPSVFLIITSSNTAGYSLYRQISVLFQILFEYEFITRINRKYFLPWQTNTVNSMRKEKYMKYDNDFMYLVRVVPRKNLFEHFEAENLTALWFFIKQHLRSRSKAVIPAMEQWIPGCGPRLIINSSPTTKAKDLFPTPSNNFLPEFHSPCQTLSSSDFYENIHVFTQFGNLTPMQIFTVFTQFISWPEYESCAFNTMLEKHLEKFYTNPDEDACGIDSEDEEEEEIEVHEEFETKNN